MSKIYYKIENLINTGLFFLWDLFVLVSKRIIPKKIFVWAEQSRQFFLQKTQSIKQKIGVRTAAFFNFFNKHISFVKTYPIKEKIITPVKQRAERSLEFAKENKSIQAQKALLRNFLGPRLQVFIEKLKTIDPKTFAAGTVFFTFVCLISLVVFDASKDIIYDEKTHQETGASRSIASSNQRLGGGKIPYYYTLPKKISSLTHLRLPAYFENTGDFTTLDLDINIHFKNVTSKKYFDKNRHLFLDQMQMTIEPIIPSFPLKKEGKDILQKKIKEEFNILFEKLEAGKGVEEINIKHINAT
jgi:hypothetical protein